MKKLFVLLVFVLALAGCVQDGETLTIFTADPNVAIHFRLLPPPPGAPVAPAIVPDPTAVAIEETEADQTDCNIAGNVASDGTLLYHMPDGIYYSRVKIDLTRSNADGVFEQWFCSESDALDAGFRKSTR